MKSNNDEGLQVWQMIQWNGHKKNTYTMTVKAANGDGGAWVTVRYEMFGYDSLLGSHYDKYYLDYFNFLPDVSDDEFDLPSDLSRLTLPFTSSSLLFSRTSYVIAM